MTPTIKVKDFSNASGMPKSTSSSTTCGPSSMGGTVAELPPMLQVHWSGMNERLATAKFGNLVLIYIVLSLCHFPQLSQCQRRAVWCPVLPSLSFIIHLFTY
eukprot:150716-Amphidinium_carterae.1